MSIQKEILNTIEEIAAENTANSTSIQIEGGGQNKVQIANEEITMLLAAILKEVKITNTQLSLLTDTTITTREID